MAKTDDERGKQGQRYAPLIHLHFCWVVDVVVGVWWGCSGVQWSEDGCVFVLGVVSLCVTVCECVHVVMGYVVVGGRGRGEFSCVFFSEV